MAEAHGGEAWSPVIEEESDAVGAGAAAALHGLLDAPGPPPRQGEVLPPLWHWLAFLPRVPQRELGPDGHPRRGGFLPPVRLPRRMYGGGSVELLADLEVGASLQRTSVVTSVEEKTGRSGPLVFVEVEHRYSSQGEPALLERQTIVYRDRGGAAPAGNEASLEEGVEWPLRLELDCGPTLLFRFSALTYNAHRIHYDRLWATEVEGYPGLVVHGPLQAVGLAELWRRNLPGLRMRKLSFRAVRPAFDGHPLLLRGRRVGAERVELRAFDHEHRVTMEAFAEGGS